MRAVVFSALAAVLCALAPSPAAAPSRHDPLVPLGFVAGRARVQLQADWDSLNTEPAAPERGYCVTRDSVAADWRDAGYSVVYVLDVERAHETGAGPMHVRFNCGNKPSLHTHAGYCQMSLWGEIPSTCLLDAPEAYQCDFSVPDLRMLTESGAPYEVVECGRDQFVFAWRQEP